MKKLILLIGILFFSIVSCNKRCNKKDSPACLDEKTTEFSKNACENSNVKEYKFQNKNVYVFDPGNCGADMTSEVIDSDCKSIGYLGGITGNTIINGEDFSKASYVNTTWKK